jgi:uncharacterized protein involved in exopolysaccharide biosynthesis
MADGDNQVIGKALTDLHGLRMVAPRATMMFAIGWIGGGLTALAIAAIYSFVRGH